METGLIKRKTNLHGWGGQPCRLACVLSHHLVEKSILVIYKIKISRFLIIMEIGLGFARQQE